MCHVLQFFGTSQLSLQGGLLYSLWIVSNVFSALLFPVFLPVRSSASFSTPIACIFFLRLAHSTCSVGGRSVPLARSFACWQDRWRVFIVAAQFREQCVSFLADKDWAPAKPKIGRHPLIAFFPHTPSCSRTFLMVWLYYLHSSRLCVPTTRHLEYVFGAVCSKKTAVEMLWEVLPLPCW